MPQKNDLHATFRKILSFSKRISQHQVATMLECSEQELSLLLLEWAESEAFMIDGPDILRAEIEAKSKTDAFVQKSGEQYLKRNTISPQSRKNGPKEYIFKTVVVGNISVGKRSMVGAFTEEIITEQNIDDIGFDCRVHLIRKPEENIVVRLQLLVLGKIPKFRRPSFYRGAFACVYVFDLTSKESFDSIEEWKRVFVMYNPNVPSMLVGTKVDLKEDRVISRTEGEALAAKIGVPYYETSIQDPPNITKCFYELGEILLDKHVRTKY